MNCMCPVIRNSGKMVLPHTDWQEQQCGMCEKHKVNLQRQDLTRDRVTPLDPESENKSKLVKLFYIREDIHPLWSLAKTQACWE